MEASTLDLSLRLGAAAVGGAVIGIERQSRSHAAGMRTHALVALGAALFTIAGAYGFAGIPRGPNVDPARVAAQIASGIGFIGAGAIIRDGGAVRGLTTAATLWIVASIGMASGAGLYAVVLIASVIAFAILVGMRRMSGFIDRRSTAPMITLVVVYDRGHGTLGPLVRAIESSSATMQSMVLSDDDDEAIGPGTREARLSLRARTLEELSPIADELRQRPEVKRVTLSHD
jgi:putative Mg2+ transporter-C (MgtC) family protein